MVTLCATTTPVRETWKSARAERRVCALERFDRLVHALDDRQLFHFLLLLGLAAARPARLGALRWRPATRDRFFSNLPRSRFSLSLSLSLSQRRRRRRRRRRKPFSRDRYSAHVVSSCFEYARGCAGQQAPEEALEKARGAGQRRRLHGHRRQDARPAWKPYLQGDTIKGHFLWKGLLESLEYLSLSLSLESLSLSNLSLSLKSDKRTALLRDLEPPHGGGDSPFPHFCGRDAACARAKLVGSRQPAHPMSTRATRTSSRAWTRTERVLVTRRDQNDIFSEIKSLRDTRNAHFDTLATRTRNWRGSLGEENVFDPRVGEAEQDVGQRRLLQLKVRADKSSHKVKTRWHTQTT